MDFFEMLSAPSGWLAGLILVVILAFGVLAVIALCKNHLRRSLVFASISIGLGLLCNAFVSQHISKASPISFLGSIGTMAALVVLLLLVFVVIMRADPKSKA